jgi:predicted nucleic acid-binding protein
VSDAGTIAEIDVCPEPKRTQMFAKLKEIKYTILKISPEVSSLAGAYIADNVLTKKSYDDCQHIAFAVVNSCDVIVSWNFKHLVNIRTIDGVKIVNTKNLYGEIKIVTPTMIIGGQNGRK